MSVHLSGQAVSGRTKGNSPMFVRVSVRVDKGLSMSLSTWTKGCPSVRPCVHTHFQAGATQCTAMIQKTKTAPSEKLGGGDVVFIVFLKNA